MLRRNRQSDMLLISNKWYAILLSFMKRIIFNVTNIDKKSRFPSNNCPSELDLDKHSQENEM